MDHNGSKEYPHKTDLVNKFNTSTHVPNATLQKCPIHSTRNIQAGHYNRFHNDNIDISDDDLDQTSDTQTLLVGASGHSGGGYGSIQETAPREALPSDSTTQLSKTNRSIEKLPFLMINIIVMLLSASGRFHHPLMNQYLYQRYADDVLGNASSKTASHPCLNDSTSDPTKTASIRKVQGRTSEMLLYLDLCNYLLGIPACLVMGALTNTLSRKQLLAIPVLGYLIKCLVIAGVVYWHLQLNWFFLGFAGEGALGNLCGFYFGAFLYTSDITARDKTRTMGVSILDGLNGLLVAGINTVSGQLIQRTGFVPSAILSVGCVVLSLVGIMFLPNRKPRQEYDCTDNDLGLVSRWWKQLMAPWRTTNANRRMRTLLLIGGIAFMLSLSACIAMSKMETLYIMNMPFCFDASTVGWYLFGRELAAKFFLIVAVTLFLGCMPGMGLGILGSCSSLLGSVMYAVATSDIAIYHIVFIAMGQYLPMSIIRGETSRLFGPEVQGPLFAIFAILECVGYTGGTSALSIYKASLVIYKGLSFLVFGAVMIAVIVLLLFYQVIWKRHILEELVKELRRKSESSTQSPS